MVTLKKVNSENIWKIIKLTVRREQKSFVATNAESLLEAYTTVVEGGTALPFGIYDGDKPVGFVMFGYGTTDEENEPAAAKNGYCIWRFMIDKRYQGKGLGKQALKVAIEYVKTRPCGSAEYCWLSYEKENTRAKALYESEGFRESGEVCGGETVSVLKI